MAAMTTMVMTTTITIIEASTEGYVQQWVSTKPTFAGRRVGAHVDETFVIPAEDGKIHHIRAIVRPFLTSA